MKCNVTLSAYETDLVIQVLGRVLDNLTLEEDGNYHEISVNWMLSMDRDAFGGIQDAIKKMSSTLPPPTRR